MSAAPLVYDWKADTMAASTILGLQPISVMRLGPLAAHCMFSDDGGALDGNNGYCVSLFDRGLRMSYGHRTWRDLGSSMLFIEALTRTGLDWPRWFDAKVVPSDLADAFGAIQARLTHLLKPDVYIIAAGGFS